MKINCSFQLFPIISALLSLAARPGESPYTACPLSVPESCITCITQTVFKDVVRSYTLGSYPTHFNWDMSGSRGNSEHDSTRYPCGVCEEEVVDFDARADACNSCDRWIRKSCVGMLTAEYDQLAETSQPWFCPDCGTAHHSSVIYDIPVSDVSDKTSSHSSISSEDAITSPQPSSFQQSCASSLFDSSINSIDSAGATSSPQPTRPSHATSQCKRSLRILVINFQSVRKKGKNIYILVETTCPDVILGTETWLSNDIP